MRGRGRSAYDPKPENYHPGTYVGDMVALLDHLKLERVAIIGTSLGGLMAMMMSAGFPQRIAGIVVNDVGPELAVEGLVKIQSYINRETKVLTWDDAIADVSGLFLLSFPKYSVADWERMTRALYRETASGVPVLDFDPAIANNFKALEPKAVDLWPVFDAMPSIPLWPRARQIIGIAEPQDHGRDAAPPPGDRIRRNRRFRPRPDSR